MLTEKDYCDYDTCVALKELGLSCDDVALKYEANSFACRYEDIPKPSLYEAQKWLREEKNIIVNICYYQKTDKYNEHWYWISYQNGHQKNISGNSSATYEEALSEGIKEAIKLLKEEKL